ncbi:hypothetical protein GUITHDRAFT_143293 [Guillardia theta CCMP2712]|uniref:Uncharacterized protein n=1 Tax=Guillardia theta (strain CCMP2712) TaxID=905079 RepID=L1ITW4_GUITC|nr:hypothetical protein GUITHDRAFT_143293 [Guillardia theta CCMP2712]EKX39706.1 hypothetical protein GUITHDRAFT_143293 [Guillardia theta CCMP2712]|eukprot:XP_005826686.1 hypothetical protein GUITHDRAFT_143293 [Guillardia theta CCMP2712]
MLGKAGQWAIVLLLATMSGGAKGNGFFDKVGKRSEILLRKIPNNHGIELEMPTTAIDNGATLKLGSAFNWCPVLRDRSEWRGVMTERLRCTFYNHLFGQTSGLEVINKIATGPDGDGNVQVNMRFSPTARLSLEVAHPEPNIYISSNPLMRIGEVRMKDSLDILIIVVLEQAISELKGKLGVEINNEHLSIGATRNFVSNQLQLSALTGISRVLVESEHPQPCAGAGGWAGGVKAILNTRKRSNKLSDVKLALQYTVDNLQVSCLDVGCVFSDDMRSYTASFHHTLSNDLQIAV